MDANKLKIAEHFYSIQGEGLTVGVPAVFLRLSMCNFMCQWCDTVEVWKKGEWMEFVDLDGLFDMSGYYDKMRRGAHLVLTGGDPLIQQEALVNWFKLLKEFGRDTSRFFVELETQGHLMPSKELAAIVRQWNVSPKLTNSGMPLEKRIRPDVLAYHAAGNSCFKFPVRNDADLREVEAIVHQHRIRRSRVYLMPVCNTRAEHQEVSAVVTELCKKSGYHYSPRLQLVLWDKATGV